MSSISLHLLKSSHTERYIFQVHSILFILQPLSFLSSKVCQNHGSDHWKVLIRSDDNIYRMISTESQPSKHKSLFLSVKSDVSTKQRSSGVTQNEKKTKNRLRSILIRSDYTNSYDEILRMSKPLVAIGDKHVGCVLAVRWQSRPTTPSIRRMY